MASILLMKTRRLNRLLQTAAGQSVNFMDMAEVLQQTIEANVYVISRKGKILGYSNGTETIVGSGRYQMEIERRVPDSFNSLLKQIEATASSHDELGIYDNVIRTLSEQLQMAYLAVVPINGRSERIGTLVISRENQAFSDDDYILAEYGSTIVGMEIVREHVEEAEEEMRNRAAVQIALESLSYSEAEALEHIFEELEGNSEGLLVASKIADRVGITRSVIVNALRKLESAAVVETRSLGMKGTYIKIRNSLLIKEISKGRA